MTVLYVVVQDCRLFQHLPDHVKSMFYLNDMSSLMTIPV